MKKTLLLIMLAIAGLTATAQYQPVRMVQPLEVSHYRSLIVNVFGNGLVNVVQDVDDYVVFHLCTADDTATLPDGIMKVWDSDFGYGNIGITSYPTVLNVELHLKADNLYITACDYSTVNLTSANNRDSLVYNSLTLQADDHATTMTERHVHAEAIKLRASYFGLVRCYSYTSPLHEETHWGNGIIRVGVRNGEYDHNTAMEMTTLGNTRVSMVRYKPIERVHLSLLSGFHNWGTSQLNGLAGTEYVFDYRDVAYWERNAWEDAASARTTLGNLQLELSYDIVAREHYTIGLGLGYERNSYSLRHSFVSWVEATDIPVQTNKINTTLYDYTGFTILPEIGVMYRGRDQVPGSWSTRFTTNYLAMPIQFTYHADRRHTKGFHAGVAVIPGMAISKGTLTRHFSGYGGKASYSYDPVTGDTTWGFIRYDAHDEQSVKVNAKVDVRLTVGWANWSVFLQLSTMPVLADKRTLGLYPMKLGLKIQL